MEKIVHIIGIISVISMWIGVILIVISQNLLAGLFIVIGFNGMVIGNVKLKWNNECIILIIAKDELGFYFEILSQKDKKILDFDIRFYRCSQSAEIVGSKFDTPENAKEDPKGFISRTKASNSWRKNRGDTCH